jgi:hypothetical protein
MLGLSKSSLQVVADLPHQYFADMAALAATTAKIARITNCARLLVIITGFWGLTM